MLYNPAFYAPDPEWIEWVAAEYEARKAHDDLELAYTYWTPDPVDSLQRYATVATNLATRIEDDTEVRLLEAEQAEGEW